MSTGIGRFPKSITPHTCACGTVTPDASPRRKRCDACNAAEWRKRHDEREKEKRA